MPNFRYALRNGDKTSTASVLIDAGTSIVADSQQRWAALAQQLASEGLR